MEYLNVAENYEEYKKEQEHKNILNYLKIMNHKYYFEHFQEK